MTHILIIGALPESLVNFRGDLIRKIVRSGYKVTGIANNASAEVVAQLAAMGAYYLDYPVSRRGINPFEDAKTCVALYRIINQLKPDVVLAYTIKPVVWGGVASRFASVRSFYAMIEGLGFAFQGGNIRRNILGRMVAFMYKLALNRARKVIFLNTDNRQTFLDQKIINEDKAAMIDGIGVNLDDYHQTSLPTTAKHNLVFLSIGRLLGDKGFREFAQSARLVKLRYPEAIFRLVGPTDPSPDGISLEEVHGWQEAGWIEYLGVAKDVRPHLKDSHVYVLPSYHEGLPRTIQEAMAIGRPILTTDVPGCRETVIPGDNGWLVPKADAQALAESMIWFIENSDELQRMANRSREMAEKRFDVHKINRELMEIMGLSPEETFHSKARSPEEV